MFDTHISEDIPLWRVVDCFLDDGEQPSVILNFLLGYPKNDIADILSGSNGNLRILDMSFLERCKFSDIPRLCSVVESILDMSKNNPSMSPEMKLLIDSTWLFVWQILRYSKDTYAHEKFKGIFSRRNNDNKLSHPHSSGFGSKIRNLDDIYKQCDYEAVGFLEKLEELGMLDTYMSNLENSLFSARILQLDVFEQLSKDLRKRMLEILRNSMKGFEHYPCWKMVWLLFSQILGDNAQDIETKEMIALMLRSYYVERRSFISDNDVKEMISIGNGSYAPIAFELRIRGVSEHAKNLILYLLATGRIDMLKEMYESDRDVLVDNLNICDLLEYWESTESK